jgi:hypothetical protein
LFLFGAKVNVDYLQMVRRVPLDFVVRPTTSVANLLIIVEMVVRNSLVVAHLMM